MLSRFTPIFRLFGHCRYTFCKVKRNVPTSQSVSFLDRLFAHQWDGWFWTRKEEEKKRKRYEINRSKVQSFLSLYDYYWKFDTFHFNSLDARYLSPCTHTSTSRHFEAFKCDLREKREANNFRWLCCLLNLPAIFLHFSFHYLGVNLATACTIICY